MQARCSRKVLDPKGEQNTKLNTEFVTIVSWSNINLQTKFPSPFGVFISPLLLHKQVVPGSILFSRDPRRWRHLERSSFLLFRQPLSFIRFRISSFSERQRSHFPPPPLLYAVALLTTSQDSSYCLADSFNSQIFWERVVESLYFSFRKEHKWLE